MTVTVSKAVTTEVSEEDIAAVRAVVAAADSAQDDINAFGDLLTDDAVLVNLAGYRSIGRDGYYQAVKDASEGDYIPHRFFMPEVDIVFARADVAIASAMKDITYERDPRETHPTMTRRGLMTLLITKESDGWGIAMAQTTAVPD